MTMGWLAEFWDGLCVLWRLHRALAVLILIKAFLELAQRWLESSDHKGKTIKYANRLASLATFGVAIITLSEIASSATEAGSAAAAVANVANMTATQQTEGAAITVQHQAALAEMLKIQSATSTDRVAVARVAETLDASAQNIQSYASKATETSKAAFDASKNAQAKAAEAANTASQGKMGADVGAAQAAEFKHDAEGLAGAAKRSAGDAQTAANAASIAAGAAAKSENDAQTILDEVRRLMLLDAGAAAGTPAIVPSPAGRPTTDGG